MIMDNPTQGIDVGAKYAIYKLILELAAQGRVFWFSVRNFRKFTRLQTGVL